MTKNKISYSLEMPILLKARLLELSTKRKITNQPRSTMNKIIIELLEVGLEKLESQTDIKSA
jgi:predicted DNA-binding protein